MRGIDGLPIVQNSAGVRHYYLQDHLGSTVGLVSSAGTLTDTYTYSPYGIELTHSGGTQNPWGFAGGQADDPARQIKFGQRYYNPTLGRWTQTDPQPSGARYTYGFNNPVNLTDTNGAWPHWHRPHIHISRPHVGRWIRSAGRHVAHAAAWTARQAWHGSRWVARQAWHGSRWVARQVWRGAVWAARKVWRGVQWVYHNKYVRACVYGAVGTAFSGYVMGVVAASTGEALAAMGVGCVVGVILRS